jgi:hypothetical protein
MDAIKSLDVSDDGKTFTEPESRIGTAQDAYDTLTTLIQAEDIRSKKRARFNGMYNGNPPWNPKLLESKGMAERANFTERGAEGFVAAAKTPYFALFFKPDRFIQLTLEYGPSDGGSAPMLQDIARKIATRYQYALDDWKGLDMTMQHSQFQMVVHGSGPLIWEDDDNFMSCSKNAGQLLLTEDASCDLDENETVGLTRSFSPTQLWRKVRNESAATTLGWNVELAKTAIMNAASDDLKTILGNNWERYEQEMRKGCSGYDAKSKRIFVGDLFQKEFNGKISHFTVLIGDGAKLNQAVNDSDKKKGFLFKKLNRYKAFTDFINPMLFDVGPDKQWHSVKGAGPKIFDFCSVSDRLNCRMVDGGMKAAGIVVKASDAKVLQEAAFTDVSGGTVVGPGYDVMQQRVQPDLQSPLIVKRDLQNTLQSNTGGYRQRVSDENQEPTLGQAQLNASQQAFLGEGDASRYYKYADSWHSQTLKRMLKLGKQLYDARDNVAPTESDDDENMELYKRIALRFYRGLVLLDQIPEKLLEFHNFCSIKATRLVGNGSAQMRQIISTQLMKHLPIADERGRNIICRNDVAAWADQDMADAIYPPYDTPQIADAHITLATLENNILKMPNAEVEVEPGQADVTHFGVHQQGVANHSKLVQAGQADPHALVIHLDNAGPHMLKHLLNVENDPTRSKDQVKGMRKAWVDMTRNADQLKQQVAEADQAEADKKPQIDPQLIAALAEVSGNLQIKRKKMMGDMAIKAETQRIKNSLADIDQAHKMRLETADAVNSARQTKAA